MGFFDKVFKEISRPFKQVGREIERAGKKTDKELRRVNEQLLDSIGLGKPKFPAPPVRPKPIPPVTRLEGGATDEIRRRQRGKVSGRGDTIVTGQLSPEKVGKKSLLGR